MVEVFKTNVQKDACAAMLVQLLSQKMIAQRITFDLDDCDSILRIEAVAISAQKVVELMVAAGFECAALDD